MPRKYLKVFLLIYLIPIFYAIIAFYNDPLMIFRGPQDGEGYILKRDSKLSRFQVSGIINSLSDEFDSVILGTSVTCNLSANYTSEKLGGSFANLSINGSNFNERALILKKLLKKKPDMKSVIYSLDDYYLSPVFDANKISSFDYLYDDNKFNDIRVYFDKRFVIQNLMFKKNKLYHSYQSSLDSPYRWSDKEHHMKKFGGIDKWLEHKDHQITHSMGRIRKIFLKNRLEEVDEDKINNKILKSKKIVNKYLVDFVKENPDIKFYVFIPPYYRTVNMEYLNSDKELIRHAIVRYISSLSDIYQNLKFFGFENENFLDNIVNYKDNVHYHPRFDRFIIDSISKNKNIITHNNVDRYLSLAVKKAKEFDLRGVYRYLEDHGAYK